MSSIVLLLLKSHKRCKDVQILDASNQTKNTSEPLGDVLEELQERTEHFKALATKKGCDVPWLQTRTVSFLWSQICMPLNEEFVSSIFS